MTIHQFPTPPQPERPPVDISGCLDGSRVWIRGEPFEDFDTLTAAARVASALTTLNAYGLLDRVASARDQLRIALALSLAEVSGGEPIDAA